MASLKLWGVPVKKDDQSKTKGILGKPSLVFRKYTYWAFCTMQLPPLQKWEATLKCKKMLK